MQDDWFGHRNPLTNRPQGDKDAWIDWDHALVSAFQTAEVFTDQDGIYRWDMDNDYVVVDAVRKINKFHEARDLITSGKRYNPRPGEYFVPDVKTRHSSGELPTYLDWVEEQREKDKDPN